MSVRYESISDKAFYEYEKLFFEEICGLNTEGRDSFDTALPGPLEQIRFACVQDTVERLTELTGRLSTFQWRNCLFVPIDRNIRPNDIYEEVYEQLKQACPSLFIRAYVYVVFIKVYGAGTLGLGVDVDGAPISKDDMQIYAWNTNYDIKPQGKVDLFNLASSKEIKGVCEEERKQPALNKVFIVRNPDKEFQRIQDANSDVIDAMRAYLGKLDLIQQTEAMLKDVEAALDGEKDARVLLEGPARSGKTVVAMSLLSKYPNSRMLLMNWYFYRDLRDAFMIWGDMDAAGVEKLFAPDPKLLQVIREKKAVESIIQVPELLACEIEMRELPYGKFDAAPRWVKSEAGDWRLSNIGESEVGDYVFCYVKKSRKFKIVKLTEISPEDGTAGTDEVFSGGESKWHTRCLDDPEENERKLKTLYGIKTAIDSSTVGEALATLLKEIADALSSSRQRFFHHDRRQRDGLWVDGGTILIPSNAMLVCDESQRLGVYGELDEVGELAGRSGRLFLCGDDCQRLNRKGDLGVTKLIESANVKFDRFQFPESVGIPSEVEELVKSLLGECDTPKIDSSFELKLIFNDDPLLVSAFAGDASCKKHFAIPNSSGFYQYGCAPSIKRYDSVEANGASEYGEGSNQRIIPMLTQELAEKYKYFCAEAIMPNYALSAYELISREVESVYLKIPKAIGAQILSVSLNGEEDVLETWIKRHLYVLMTRATARLVINIEDRELYDNFCQVCIKAGLNYEF